MSNLSNSKPSVSVAMCTYNGAKYLVEQIDSILNQGYPNIIEIVCVDDNSSDNTWELLESYAKKDARLKLHKNETNLGFIRNFEKAISLTSSELIAIADQDDIWAINKIEKLVAAIGDNLMAYSDNEYIDGNGNKLGKRFSDFRQLKTAVSCLNFAFYNGISGHTILFNKKLLDFAMPFDRTIPYDYWLAFHAAQHGQIPYVDEPLVQYRQHESNAIGATGVRKVTSHPYSIKTQLTLFAAAAQYATPQERKVLERLAPIISDYSLKSRILKVGIFLANRNNLLFFRRRNTLRKTSYCFKMFYKKL